MKLRDGLRGLRNDGECQEVWRHLIAGSLRDGFRIVHATVQSNHLHLLCEGESRDSLWRGMCGVATRIAKGLNRFWGRRGKVFKERYHDRVMGSPKEVRRALAYLFGNAAHHGRPPKKGRVDGRSSAPWFDGWMQPPGNARPHGEHPLARARSFLLRTGWKRWGLLVLEP